MVKSNIMLGRLVLECGVIFLELLMETAVSVDNSSLAYSVQLNPDYLLILADSNDYGKEESSTAPATAGFFR